MSEPDVIDRAALADLLATTGGDPEFVAELIGDYLADTPQLLASMQQALATGDSAELKRAAHTLKGSSGYFGANRLAELCRTLEEQAAAGVLDGAGELVTRIAAEFHRVRPMLISASENIAPA